MISSDNAVPQHSALLDRFVHTREWLRGFPLSIVQLAMRVGVGLAFFSSGLLKYKSFDYATQLFEEAYKFPLLAPDVAARIAMINELTCSTLLMLGFASRLATTVARYDLAHSNRLPRRLARSCPLGIDTPVPADARTGFVLNRPSHRTVFSGAPVIERPQKVSQDRMP